MGFHQAVKAFLDCFPERIDVFEDLLTNNDVWKRRTQRVGVLTQQQAIESGCVGPIAARHRAALRRPADVPLPELLDLRLRGPDAAERRRLLAPPGAREGDARERQDRAPGPRSHHAGGEWAVNDPRIVPPPKDKVYTEMEALIQHFLIDSQGFTVPAGEAYVPIEGPRGEHGFYVVSDGGDRPWRIKSRPPSFLAIQAMPKIDRRRADRRRASPSSARPTSSWETAIDEFPSRRCRTARAGTSRTGRCPMKGRRSPSPTRTAAASRRSPRHYPPEQRKSAIIAALYLGQEQQGYVSRNAIEHVAEVIGCTAADVEDVVAVLRDVLHQAGRDVRRCRCAGRSRARSNGAERVTDVICKHLHVRPGETDATGTFTVQEFECPRRVRSRAGRR